MADWKENIWILAVKVAESKLSEEEFVKKKDDIEEIIEENISDLSKAGEKSVKEKAEKIFSRNL